MSPHPDSQIAQIFLEPDRRSNADLIVVKAEEIYVAAVLAVQVVHPSAKPPGNQHVKRRLDKPVIVVPERVDIVVSGEVIRAFITARQTQINAVEQTLLKAPDDIRVREILASFKPGIVNPAPSGQCHSCAFKWIV